MDIKSPLFDHSYDIINDGERIRLYVDGVEITCRKPDCPYGDRVHMHQPRACEHRPDAPPTMDAYCPACVAMRTTYLDY